ncbi:segregation and condensation protein A [Faecalicoccus pleomorphus]|uniref:segregation and condensation protein A n=1 Tax=Faecalicoccus pleomorphus TaxID=1323 RepID=UPI00242F7153|nr:segregation/condensation protein A [Faecalicoccus pleomorphus]
MEFKVTIDQFEGPLDLMLHLIKENKLDLFDLDMLVLANQYIDFIHQMKDLHLEVASEYLSELASLVEYKSRKLLPREEVVVEEEYEEETQRQRLVERLLEYQRYKEVSASLKDSFEQRQLHFSRPTASLIESWAKPIEIDDLPTQSPYELVKAMQRVMHRMILLQPYETKVTIKELSVEERLEQIQRFLNTIDHPITFEELCSDCTNLHMIVVTFLAILDLIHQKMLDFTINEEDQIYLKKGEQLHA